MVGERAAVDGSREGALCLAPMRGSFSPTLAPFFLNLDFSAMFLVLAGVRFPFPRSVLVHGFAFGSGR